MTVNCYSVETPEVAFLKKDLDGLNEVYKEIADEIGIENALAMYRLFRGTQVSFPNRLLVDADADKPSIKELSLRTFTRISRSLPGVSA